MKNSIKTDEFIDYINAAIAELNEFKGDAAGNLYVDDWLLSLVINDIEEKLGRIVIEDIRHEFWETCADYDKILANRHIFEVKFEKLLSWKYSNINTIENNKLYRFEIMEFFSYRENINMSIDLEVRNEIFGKFIYISDMITRLKSQIVNLLEQLEKMGEPFSEPILKKGRYTKSEPNEDIKYTRFKLASKRKTDFIKLVSAMYDARMFETSDGFIASSKQALLNEFGKILNENFSAYSTTLSQAKNAEKESFMKPFKEISRKAEDYYNLKNEN